jgi:hypothetical protein
VTIKASAIAKWVDAHASKIALSTIALKGGLDVSLKAGVAAIREKALDDDAANPIETRKVRTC